MSDVIDIINDVYNKTNNSIRTTGSSPYASMIDDYTTTNVTYFGYAAAGSLTSSAVWRMKIFDETGDYLIIKWADGNSDFDNEWDNRASLSYS